MSWSKVEHLAFAEVPERSASEVLTAFPELFHDWLKISRQEVYFFVPPAGDHRFQPPALPVWLEYGSPIFYGIPSASNLHGFKAGDDIRTFDFDLKTEDRIPTPERLTAVRAYLAKRFPALAKAPLQESRICQYLNSPDGHFVIDRHPEANNLWIAGAGTGHGFKLGPAVGEHLAQKIMLGEEGDPVFSINRSQSTQKEFTQFKVD